MKIKNSCNTCGKNFTNRNDLKQHMNEHITKTNERETEFRFSGVYLCDKCEAVFSNNLLLKEHDKNSHIDNLDIEIDIQEINAIPVIKPQHFHCSLNEDTTCGFQCETQEELKKNMLKTHIEVKINYSVQSVIFSSRI